MNYKYHHEILEVLNDFSIIEPEKTYNEDGSFQESYKANGLDKEEIIDKIKTKRKKNVLNLIPFRKIKDIEPSLADLKNSQSISSKLINNRLLYWILDKGRNDLVMNLYKTKHSSTIRKNWITIISVITTLIAVIISGLSLFFKNEEKSKTEIYLIKQLETKENQIKNQNDSLVYYKEKIEQLKRKNELAKNKKKVKKGINNSTLIDDSYSSDFQSLKIALDF